MTRFAVGGRALILCVVSAVVVACGGAEPTDSADAGTGTPTLSSLDASDNPTSSASGSASGAAPEGGTTTDRETTTESRSRERQPSGSARSSSPRASSAPSAGRSSAGQSPGTPTPAPPPAASSPGNAPASSASSSSSAGTPANPPPAENTDAPLTENNRPSGPRTVEVSGPTLDGKYREAPLTFEASGTKCWPFTSGRFAGDPEAAQVPVTIRSVSVIGRVPVGTTAFQLVPVADYAACDVGEPLDISTECSGATLPPLTDTEGVACAVRVSFTSDNDGLAILRFSMEATCTEATAAPCDKLAGTADSPTPGSQVTVRWTVDKYLNACPQTPPAGIGGNCPEGTYGN